MAIRRQTVVLFVALLGVGMLALLHHRRVETVASGSNPRRYHEPTPTQLQATFNMIKFPQGFHRPHSCWLSGKGFMCMVRDPSFPLTLARYERLASEAGLKPLREQVMAPRCMLPFRFLKRSRRLSWMTCQGIEGMVGSSLVTVSAHSLVRSAHGQLRGTSGTFRTSGGFTLRGTEIDFFDTGIPPRPRRGGLGSR